MARDIRIDEDTVVGYNFLLSKFYLENKGTITYRDTATLIREILLIVAPTTTVTLQQIQALKDNYETLNSLYFTWYDNGSFIKTIQLNTYDKFPLVLDAFKKKLYIMNTNLIFDLILNEGKQYRVDYLCSYYLNNIGLQVTKEEMGVLYDLLVAYYNNQIVYNEIDLTRLSDDLTTLYYNNIYSLTNYNEKGNLVYSCTANPNSKYQDQSVAGIVGLDQTNKQIILQGTPNTTLVVGQEIKIYNLTTVIDGVSYSADGTYTLASQENNILTIAETLPFNYSFPYPQAYLMNSITSITSIARDTLTITLSTNVPNTIQVGDIIHVEGTQQAIDNETVSADGEYTVASISSNKIVVQEQPSTNYTYSSGTYPTVSKHTLLGNVTSISNKQVNLDKSITTLSANTKVLIDTTQYTVTSSTTTSFTVSETISDYTPTYPQLQVNTPYTDVLIDITTSNITDHPTGEFMVDNFTQCQQYISTYSSTLAPTTTNNSNINTQLSTTMQVVLSSTKTISMQLKGIYSKIYSGN